MASCPAATRPCTTTPPMRPSRTGSGVWLGRSGLTGLGFAAAVQLSAEQVTGGPCSRSTHPSASAAGAGRATGAGARDARGRRRAGAALPGDRRGLRQRSHSRPRLGYGRHGLATRGSDSCDRIRTMAPGCRHVRTRTADVAVAHAGRCGRAWLPVPWRCACSSAQALRLRLRRPPSCPVGLLSGDRRWPDPSARPFPSTSFRAQWRWLAVIPGAPGSARGRAAPSLTRPSGVQGALSS